MRIQLHEFQRKAVGELLAELEEARGELERRGKHQALVLSAPTGSGKTVIMSALIEAVLDAGHPDGEASEFPDHKASFLWITDQPELNTQTMNRMRGYLDNIWFGKIEEIDDSFDREQLEAGKLYFINTQKLGKKGRLVTRGDRRQHTFWDAMRNTVDDRPSSVYVVIDEAHRGMAETARKQRQNEKDAESIVQRFIKGDTASGMPAVPIILGVSATPERFKKLLEGTDRRERPVDVDSGDVQRSGLLKESILLRHSSSPADREMTLLHNAARRFLRFEEAWRAHHQRSGGHLVRPIMLVQVEDASSADQKQGRHSATDLAEALGVISGELRSGGVVLGPKVFAHAFQDAKMLDVSGTDLRGLAPAEIDDDPHVRVVFFKTALNTGWDCPRAEVMMSFRSANDPTNIAQLVGRMVRTPLRERIEGEHSDLLNAVDLYLPRYNEEALDAVVQRLTDETEETRTPARVVAVVDLELNPALPEAKECRSLLERLPTYEMTRQRRASGAARFMKVARCLQRGPDADPVLEDATEKARDGMTEWLLSRLKEKRSKHKQQFDEALAEAGRVEIKVRRVSTADLLDDGSVEPVSAGDRPAGEPEFEEIADRDLRRRIDRADRELGEGLARYLVRVREDGIKGEVSGAINGALRRARLEVLALLAADPGLKEDLDRRADELIKKWVQHYADDIERLPDREREDLNRWLDPEGQVRQVESPSVPERITRRREKSEQNWDKHLYVEKDGRYFAKLNGWEEAVLDEELKERKDVVAWFRNKLGVDRWRLAVPYKKGVDTFLMYPDFIIFRRSGDELVADILDPHGLQFADAVAKAHGLADYAESHADSPVGRVEAIAEVDSKMQRLDLSDRKNREAVKACQNSIELAARLAGMDLTPGKEAKYKKSESRQVSDENPPHRNRSTPLRRRGHSAREGYRP